MNHGKDNKAVSGRRRPLERLQDSFEECFLATKEEEIAWGDRSITTPVKNTKKKNPVRRSSQSPDAGVAVKAPKSHHTASNASRSGSGTVTPISTTSTLTSTRASQRESQPIFDASQYGYMNQRTKQMLRELGIELPSVRGVMDTSSSTPGGQGKGNADQAL